MLLASITLTICLNFKGIQSNQYVIMDHWFTVPVMLRMEMEKTTILFLLYNQSWLCFGEISVYNFVEIKITL